MTLVSLCCGLRACLVDEAVSQLELSSLCMDLVLEGFDTPLIVSHLFSLSLQELLMFDDKLLYLTLQAIVLLPELSVLGSLLGNLLVAAVDLLLALLPAARHDQVVLPRLAQLACHVPLVARLALELQLLLCHLPLYVPGVCEEPLYAAFFALGGGGTGFI